MSINKSDSARLNQVRTRLSHKRSQASEDFKNIQERFKDNSLRIPPTGDMSQETSKTYINQVQSAIVINQHLQNFCQNKEMIEFSTSNKTETAHEEKIFKDTLNEFKDWKLESRAYLQDSVANGGHDLSPQPSKANSQISNMRSL